MPPASPAPQASAFRPLFLRWARRVRRRMLLKDVLTGVSVGLLAGALGAALAWHTRNGALRPAFAAVGLVGAAAGVAMARRRRFADPDLALYLDARLKTDEVIVTAVQLEENRPNESDEGSCPAYAVVLTQATQALARATPAAIRPPILRPWHAASPFAAAAIGYLSFLPLLPDPAAPIRPPGAERVELATVRGLEKVIKLGELDARDDAQKERLKRLAEEAKRIREKARAGAEKREVLSDIAKLRDAITAERLSLGDGEQRAGLEAALGKLGENPDLKGAEKALGDRDLVTFDEEMEQLANKLEQNDREQAKKTLEEAAEAAKRAGAEGVGKALEEQSKKLEERRKRGDKLRELAKELEGALGAEGKEALDDFERKGGGKEEQRLADELDKALGKLSPEERKRLAENLKKKMAKAPEQSPGKGPTKEQLRELQEQLSTPEGQKQLEEELKRMAEQGPESSEEAERQKGLDDAQEGAGEAEGELGGAPMPLPLAGGDKPGGGKANRGRGGDKDKDPKGEQGAGGPSPGGGPGDHKGQTERLEGGGFRAHAGAKINKGKPMPGMVMGHRSGRAGETANVAGKGALGDAAAGEIGGIERSDVPEEYREQVGRYFQPK